MQGFVQSNGTLTVNGTLEEWEEVLQDIDQVRYRTGFALPGSKELERIVEALKERPLSYITEKST